MTKLFDFSIVSDWEDRLRTLSGICEPERWNYLFVPTQSEFPILADYIKHTFQRASDQQKIVEGDNVCCFNTGLLTPSHEEIFGVFTPSDRFDRSLAEGPANKRWYLRSWSRAGDRSLIDFLELPALADYWADSRELVFDPRLQVQLNLDHIIRDNINRFPEELGGSVDRDGIPTDLRGGQGDEEIEGGEPPAVARDVPLAARNALEGAMKHSIRLAERNYRIAVPQFYRGKIQLLLPIYLRSADKPDLALTIERHGGWYRAATVLYTDWAYSHARLLARPNSEWLGGFRADLRELNH